MAASPKATPQMVKQVLLSDYDGTSDLTISLRIAASMMQRLVAYGAEFGTTVGDDEYVQLEALLAAWNYACTDKPYTSRSTMGSSGSFSGQTGMGLDANLYGQRAKLLDPTGYLTSLSSQGGRPKAGGAWLGTPARSHRSFDERQ